jgi:hypothetical protein
LIEPLPKGMKMKRRKGLWNWDINLRWSAEDRDGVLTKWRFRFCRVIPFLFFF